MSGEVTTSQRPRIGRDVWLRYLRPHETIVVNVPMSREQATDCLQSHVQAPKLRTSLLAGIAPSALGPFRTFQGDVGPSAFEISLVLPENGTFWLPRPVVRGVVDHADGITRVTATIEQDRGVGEFVLALSLILLSLFVVVSLFYQPLRITLLILSAMIAVVLLAVFWYVTTRSAFTRESAQIRRDLEFALTHKRTDLQAAEPRV